MQTHRLLVGILLVSFFVCGCDVRVSGDRKNAEAKKVDLTENPQIVFNGKTWTLIGPPWEFSDIPRMLYMNAKVYSLPNSSDEYLLECTKKDDLAYERILAVQRKFNGKILRDGPCKCWMQNGEIIEDTYRQGKLHGNQKVYYKNGGLKFDRNYVDDKLEGKAYGYNDDGSLDWEATYKDNKQIDPPIND